MELKKAIEILNILLMKDADPVFRDTDDAIQLGIEALKVRYSVKCQVSPKYYQPLPGESNGI